MILISMKVGAGLVEMGSRNTERWRRAAVASCSARTHKHTKISLCVRTVITKKELGCQRI